MKTEKRHQAIITVDYWTTSTRYRNCNHFSINGTEGKNYFYNRTWETFSHQTDMLDCLKKLNAAKCNIKYIENCSNLDKAIKYLKKYIRY